ncbi:hypothetical protein [Desulfosoma sp.]|uniref:Uncharacterized protein n=1 Tax=Desulfacinum infernum TaxID=35837 RepID=A0A831ZZT9_9BACT
MDVSLRLRFVRPGEGFRIRVTAEQRPKMERVVAHNGGVVADLVQREDAVEMLIIRHETL